MTKFDELVEKFKSVVTVLEIDLYSKTGLYGAFRQRSDGMPYIFVDKYQPEIDKQVLVMEEFKHMMTSYGVILDPVNHGDVKQENKARGLAYKELVTMYDLFCCYNQGLNSEYEIAEELDLPQEFLHNAIQYFKDVTSGPIKLDNGYIATINDTIEFYKVDDHRKAN